MLDNPAPIRASKQTRVCFLVCAWTSFSLLNIFELLWLMQCAGWVTQFFAVQQILLYIYMCVLLDSLYLNIFGFPAWRHQTQLFHHKCNALGESADDWQTIRICYWALFKLGSPYTIRILRILTSFDKIAICYDGYKYFCRSLIISWPSDFCVAQNLLFRLEFVSYKLRLRVVLADEEEEEDSSSARRRRQLQSSCMM